MAVLSLLLLLLALLATVTGCAAAAAAMAVARASDQAVEPAEVVGVAADDGEADDKGDMDVDSVPDVGGVGTNTRA